MRSQARQREAEDRIEERCKCLSGTNDLELELQQYFCIVTLTQDEY